MIIGEGLDQWEVIEEKDRVIMKNLKFESRGDKYWFTCKPGHLILIKEIYKQRKINLELEEKIKMFTGDL